MAMNTHSSFKGFRTARALSRRGFTLIEVVLGSVVLATFMVGSIYMAGEVAQSRIRGIQDRDVNAWANVQAQMAAEGIDASKTNGSVWTGKSFSSLTGGSLDANTSSASLYPTGSDPTLRSLRIHPFRVNFSAIGQRESNFSLGFRILDTETSTGAVGALTKDMDASSGQFAVAVYDHSTGLYSFRPANNGDTVVIDAWKDLQWGATGPALYILAKSTTATGIHYNEDGGSETVMLSSNPLGGGTTSYTYSSQLDTAAFTSDRTAVVNYTLAGSPDQTGSFTISVTPITPTIVEQIVNANGTVRSGSLSVTLADALPSVIPVTAAQRLQMNSGRLNIVLYGSDTLLASDRLPQSMYSFFAASTSVGLTNLAVTPDLVNPGYFFDVPAGAFSVANTPVAWKTTVIPATSSSIAQGFISTATQSSNLTPVGTTLPHINISPSAPAGGILSIMASAQVTLSPATDTYLDAPANTLSIGFNSTSFSFYLFDIRYLYSDTGGAVGPTSDLYVAPFVIGTDMTYSTSAEVDAKALNLYSDLAAFLVENTQDTALYIKNLSSGGAYVWNYAGKTTSGTNDSSSTYGTKILWSHLDTGSGAKFSWEGLKVPGTATEMATGREQNALFQSAIPYNTNASSSLWHHVQVDATYTLNGLFFDYNPTSSDSTATSGFTVERLSSSTAQKLVFKNTSSLYTEISTLSNDLGQRGSYSLRHSVTVPVQIQQPLVVNTKNAASSISLADVSNSATSSATSSDGVIKQGDGTLVLNTATTANSDNYGHKVRYVVDDGTLVFNGNNSVNKYPDDANEAGVILNGGGLDMNSYDQDFYSSGSFGDGGILTVTQNSFLRFGANGYTTAGTPSMLWVANVDVSGGKLNIFDYALRDSSNAQRPNANSADTSSLWSPKWDTFFSNYPGLPTLSTIVYPDLLNYWSGTNTRPITARWRQISTGSSYGEIIPRRPPKSSGIAYLSVSANSRIFFEGNGVKLAVEDVSIYNGAILEIRNWTTGSDLLLVAPSKDGDSQDVTTYDVYAACKYYTKTGTATKTISASNTSIRFYDDSGKFIGYGNLEGPIDVTRTDIDTGKVVTNYNVYKVTPKP